MIKSGIIVWFWYYSASKLSWQVKNANTCNSAVLHAIIMGLALINSVHEGACHT